MADRVVIRTERLVLRPFAATDVEDALPYRDDPAFGRFLPHVPQPFTRRDAEAFVTLNMSEPWDRSPTWAVVIIDEGKLIGTRAVVAWGFEVFDLDRIWASTDVRNVASQRVLQKLGMELEGRRAGLHLGRDGAAVEEVVYATARARPSR